MSLYTGSRYKARKPRAWRVVHTIADSDPYYLAGHQFGGCGKTSYEVCW